MTTRREKKRTKSRAHATAKVTRLAPGVSKKIGDVVTDAVIRSMGHACEKQGLTVLRLRRVKESDLPCFLFVPAFVMVHVTELVTRAPDRTPDSIMRDALVAWANGAKVGETPKLNLRCASLSPDGLKRCDSTPHGDDMGHYNVTEEDGEVSWP